MKIYLVGGAVRDFLMGTHPDYIKEKDYVIVGATSDDIKRLIEKNKFKEVGKDFPVFIDPKTKSEFALARTERKTGKGYAGFSFNTSPTVTLEDDLKRRDLTINAIALETNNDLEDLIVFYDKTKLKDPFAGERDIIEKKLRHVSNAFAEDPVRILRIARFASRFSDFTVEPNTVELMRQMVKAGEVDALVAERVWKEWERALQERNPERFFETLEDCGALKILFPEFNKSVLENIKKLIKAKEIKSTQQKSPEQKLLEAIFFQDKNLKSDENVRNKVIANFGVILSFLSEKEIRSICKRYRTPSEYLDFALIVRKNLKSFEDIAASDNVNLATEILNLLHSTDAFRREPRFLMFLNICLELANIRHPDFLGKIIETKKLLRECLEATKSITPKDFINPSDSGPEIANKIKDARLKEIQKILISNEENKGSQQSC